MMQTSGHYTSVDGQPVVRFERTFPHPVEAVWQAITNPVQLERWFPTTVEFQALAPGSPITFKFAQDLDGDRYPPLEGEFAAVEPPRRVAFTWGEDRLTFELEERDGGAACRLSLTVVLDS